MGWQVERGAVVWNGDVGSDGIEGIEAGDGLEDERGVGDGPRDRADGVKRIGGRNDTARTDAPVGGFEADDAAVGAGNADRTAVVTSD